MVVRAAAEMTVQPRSWNGGAAVALSTTRSAAGGPPLPFSSENGGGRGFWFCYRFGAVLCSFSAQTSSGNWKLAGMRLKLALAVQGRVKVSGSSMRQVTVMVL